MRPAWILGNRKKAARAANLARAETDPSTDETSRTDGGEQNYYSALPRWFRPYITQCVYFIEFADSSEVRISDAKLGSVDASCKGGRF